MFIRSGGEKDKKSNYLETFICRKGQKGDR